MRKTIVLLVAAAALVWGPGASAQTVPAGDLDANCQVEAPEIASFNMDQRAAAQTFTAVNGGKLTSARVLVLKDASEGTGDYVLKIAPVNASGVPTAEVLAQAPSPALRCPTAGRRSPLTSIPPAPRPPRPARSTPSSCRGATTTRCWSENTKIPAVTFRAVLGDGGSQIRLEPSTVR